MTTLSRLVEGVMKRFAAFFAFCGLFALALAFAHNLKPNLYALVHAMAPLDRFQNPERNGYRCAALHHLHVIFAKSREWYFLKSKTFRLRSNCYC